MNCRELRNVFSSTPTDILINSDGYDYFVQVQQAGRMSLLTDEHGKRLCFKNLGDAEYTLSRIGIHEASLCHTVPHDETAFCGGATNKSEASMMPLRF